jgi:arabinose-5-phosphate isomerase
VNESASRRAARRVLALEAAALSSVAERLGPEFDAAVELLADSRISIVTGLGKSGLVAAKIAATLASTGTAAHFVHASDALHGDAGRLLPGDTLIALSYSGSTSEVCSFVGIASDRSCPVIAMTGHPDSPLGRAATATIDVSVVSEADPLDLAPTASTTVMLGIGDALAVALMTRRGFTVEDFHRNHLGGALGELSERRAGP